MAALAVLVAAHVGSCGGLRPDPAWRDALGRAPAPKAGVALPAPMAGEALPAPDGDVPWRWERRAILPAPFRQACDLVSTPEGLVIAASTDALGTDGAAVFRLGEGGLERLLEWEGQGFLRVHAVGDRLLVADADAPFRVLPFAFDWDVDGWVFVSDAAGVLRRNAREVLPAVYHVFDVAFVGGTAVASTGAYPPSEVAYFSESAPAALFVDGGPGRPWRRILEYPSPDAAGVSRFTFLQPVGEDSLLAAVQTSRVDLPFAVRIEGLPEAPRAVPVEGLAGIPTRWARAGEVVYALTVSGYGSHVQASHDGGRTFGAPVKLIRPGALAAAGDSLLVLSRGALYRWDGVRAVRLTDFSLALAGARPQVLVSAALAVHDGTVFAADPRTGEILAAVPADEGAPPAP